jgi:hypothetical protein
MPKKTRPIDASIKLEGSGTGMKVGAVPWRGPVPLIAAPVAVYWVALVCSTNSVELFPAPKLDGEKLNFTTSTPPPFGRVISAGAVKRIDPIVFQAIGRSFEARWTNPSERGADACRRRRDRIPATMDRIVTQ